MHRAVQIWALQPVHIALGSQRIFDSGHPCVPRPKGSRAATHTEELLVLKRMLQGAKDARSILVFNPALTARADWVGRGPGSGMLPPILLLCFVVNVSHVRSYILSLMCLQWSDVLIFFFPIPVF